MSEDRADDETVVIMGGGIAGLGIALALRDARCRVTIVERDQAPPEIDPSLAFDEWKRPGVFQFRHPHVFLGRLCKLLRERYPELLEQLKQAGFKELPVSEYGIFQDGYERDPGDDDLVQLCGRRATFEYVLHRYVSKLPHVRILYGATITGVALAGEGSGLRAAAIELERGGAVEQLSADTFVDCMGRRSPLFGWLKEQGHGASEQSQEARTLSFSRHYRSHEGTSGQLREQSGDLDFLRYAIVYGENGHFAIGISIAETDTELIQLLKRAQGFDRVCHAIPQLREWVAGAEPVTAVMGVGDVRNRWVHWADRARPVIRGLLHAGDSAHETNPFYGRGCSAAFVDAHLVAEALLASRDPGRRARSFAARVRAELRPYYELSVSADRMFGARSRAARGLSVPLVQRFLAHVYLTLAVPAAFEDHAVARSLLGIQHMRPPYTVLDGIKLIGRMLYLAVRRSIRKRPLPLVAVPPRSQITSLARE